MVKPVPNHNHQPFGSFTKTKAMGYLFANLQQNTLHETNIYQTKNNLRKTPQCKNGRANHQGYLY